MGDVPTRTRKVFRYATYDPDTLTLQAYTPAAEAEALSRAGQALLDAEDGILWYPAPRVAGLPQMRRRLAARRPLVKPVRVRVYDSERFADTGRGLSRHHARRYDRSGEGVLDEVLGILWRPHPGVGVDTMRQRWADADPAARAWMNHTLRTATEVATDDLAAAIPVAIECLQVALERLNRGQNPREALREPPVGTVSRGFWRRLMDLISLTASTDLPRFSRPHPGFGRQQSPATALGAESDQVTDQRWFDLLVTENANPPPHHVSLGSVAEAAGCPPFLAAAVGRALFEQESASAETFLNPWDQYRLRRLLTTVVALAKAMPPGGPDRA